MRSGVLAKLRNTSMVGWLVFAASTLATISAVYLYISNRTAAGSLFDDLLMALVLFGAGLLASATEFAAPKLRTYRIALAVRITVLLALMPYEITRAQLRKRWTVSMKWATEMGLAI